MESVGGQPDSSISGRGFDLRMVLLCFVIVAGILGFAGIGRRKNSVVTELYEK